MATRRSSSGRERTFLATGISETFWCDPTGGKSGSSSFNPAVMALGTPTPGEKQKPRPICWLDEILGKGVVLPGGDDGRAVTILITGPPGTGKSTLATELAYRWASPPRPKTVLYTTTEAHAPWMIDNAAEYWTGSSARFEMVEWSASMALKKSKVNVMAVDPNHLMVERQTRTGTANWVDRLHSLLISNDPVNMDNIDPLSADVAVVDSLNTIPRTGRAIQDAFRRLMSHISSGPDIAIVILDSSAEHEVAEFWEFQCDVVIRLDWTQRVDYKIRTLEIVKARYQQHAWGTHQLKIYEPNPRDADLERAMRQHPFRAQGGIFIYPSVHYLLGIYKRETMPANPAGREHRPPCLIPTLDEALSGFPRGRCTAFLGSRGGHKSHLGLMQVLAGVIQEQKRQSRKVKKYKEKALVLSLRDDEGLTQQTMNDILEQNLDKDQATSVSRLIQQNRVEVMYFPPGYITPEEFLHRVLVSIHRLKTVNSVDEETHVSLLFNSLDQLDPRFPLCAAERIFIPALIQMLNGEGVTSYFASAADPGGDDHGLGSIAELILVFRQEVFKPQDFVRVVGEKFSEESKVLKKKLQSRRRTVVARVQRFAGGQTAGAEGILELVEDGISGSLAEAGFKLGLQYFPLPEGVRPSKDK